MTTGAVTPDRATFEALAATHPVVPVTRRLLADGETAVGTYRKLAGGIGTFLFESAEHGKSWSRYSFIGVRSHAVLSVRDGVAVWDGMPPPGAPAAGGDPLATVAATWRTLRSPRLPGLPPLTGGLVGYLGYDVARRLERLPEHAGPGLDVPEMLFLVASDLAVLDHHDGSVLLVANAYTQGSPEDRDKAYADAVARLEVMTSDLGKPAEPTAAVTGAIPAPDFRSRTPAGTYQPSVEQALEEIRAGEIFQVQIGQRFERETSAEALDIYRVLRTTNPSPYMYLLNVADSAGAPFHIVGCSPEALVTVHEGRALLHPIAGTRPRGATPEEDAALAAELLADPKERAEHVMLVDLGRNDLGRVCAPGTVTVTEFGVVERYSHVWHIVSTVVGDVAAGRDALDVLLASFPAGTLTGAPKVRAMEIIDELEPVRRGVYGGAVGYLDWAGDLDMAIAIRTAVLRDGLAYVQASAGIVADSKPEAEEAETRHKATAVLRAIATAETLRPVR